ncbi:C40 family peptidase [Ectobacillus ponti]|uniref:NlpC/P60 family protein n=1 Tax=Ectobacillus ponti TaxID=2961894 RepID=A0AA41X3G7_9BACI|nr:NlpC/P60 family protein [Ectobacillus ponti]MCP8967952.1 NlpC/P60 family protein [Ectobacillus ponti]
MLVSVPVANVWTKPVQGEWLQLALSGWTRYWIDSLTVKERYRLFEEKLLQTQVLLGEEVLVVRTEGDWAEVRVPSQRTSQDAAGYPGWMQLSQLREAVALRSWQHFIVVSPSAELYSSDGASKQVIAYQTALPVAEEQKHWVYVHTPDGIRKVRRMSGEIIAGRTPAPAGRERLLKFGRRFLGLPYLWGGNSAFGFDCSGFTHTLAKAIGRDIPRDAGDQAREGTPVEPGQQQPGDLLFFAYEQGKCRVHHVGICAGFGRMLHAPKTGRSVEIIELAGTPYEAELCAIRRL